MAGIIVLPSPLRFVMFLSVFIDDGRADSIQENFFCRTSEIGTCDGSTPAKHRRGGFATDFYIF